MRVLVIGATGFLGRGLCARLVASGHEVGAWVRSAEEARARLPSEVVLHAATADRVASLEAALSETEAVINLAGEPLFPGRWTDARKARFEASRVGLTGELVTAIESSEHKPKVLVSGSAIGIYGDRGAEVLTEGSALGHDYLAELCRRWEAAARAAEPQLRVVTLRTGLVLGDGGGLLGPMLTPFKLGLGGRLGSGEQFMSWIHQADFSRLVEATLTDSRYVGAVNAVGPSPVQNSTFTRALAEALHRPAIFHVPQAALSLALGEAAGAVLSSQRVEPAVARSCGFEFQHPTLAGALAALELRS